MDDVVCLFTRLSRYSWIDSDWVSMFLLFISWEKIILKVIPITLFLCTFVIIAVVYSILGCVSQKQLWLQVPSLPIEFNGTYYHS